MTAVYQERHSAVPTIKDTTMVSNLFLSLLLPFVVLIGLPSTTIAIELNNTGYKLLKKVIDQCDQSNDVVKCFKVQALKLADRALHSNSFKIFEGVYVVRDETDARAITNDLSTVSDEKLQSLDNNKIDGLLSETTDKFLETHKVKLDISKLIEEGRGKMRKNMGLLLAALVIKGGMMAMAMKGVAMMAGMALMVGKMALMMSSIIGIKKLIGGGGGEKTTVEIVKHPQYSYGSSYSSSYEEPSHYGHSGGGGGGGGGYHRSLDAVPNASTQERVYNAHVPNTLRR